MSVIKLSVLVILLVVATIAYRVFNAAPPPLETTVETAARLKPASDTKSTDAGLETMAPSVANILDEEESDCLTRDELNAKPLIRRLRSQADAAASNGADIEKFRGVDDASVRGFADQGDAAAMAVVGAMSVMRAYRMDVSRAVDWLANGGELEGVIMQQQQMSSDASLALNDAAYWFYQAALHGRVFALRHYGQVRGQLFGGPVGLGWVEQREYDALDPEQQQELWPVNIYRKAALDLKPRPDGDVVRSSMRLSPGSDVATQVRSDIHNEFNMAIEDAGLPSPVTSAGDLAEFQKLSAKLCAADSSRR